MSDYYKEYLDFIWHAQNIRGYGDWHCNSKTLKDFNDWLNVAELNPVTMESMIKMENEYIESGESI